MHCKRKVGKEGALKIGRKCCFGELVRVLDDEGRTIATPAHDSLVATLHDGVEFVHERGSGLGFASFGPGRGGLGRHTQRPKGEAHSKWISRSRHVSHLSQRFIPGTIVLYTTAGI